MAFALAYVPRRAIVPALILFAIISIATAFASVPLGWTDAVFYACWASVLVTAVSVNLPRPLGQVGALLLAANAALWTGGVIAVAGSHLDLIKSLPCVLLCLPARWLAARKLGIAVKVVASWLVAVSVLAAALPTFIPTPGYVGDHME